jgi:glycosyltransferase involved in cell wall biosynthesis
MQSKEHLGESGVPASMLGEPAMQVTICTTAQFPVGTATAQKIGLYARALRQANCDVTILLLDAVEVPGREHNHQAEGTWNDIPFRYAPGTTRRAPTFLGRRWREVRGLVAAALALVGPGLYPNSERRALLYIHGATQMLSLLLLCRIFGVRAAIDLCEWQPALPASSRLTRWCYDSGLVFRLSSGIIPISRLLEKKVLERDPTAISKIYYCSTLIDQSEFGKLGRVPKSGPYVLWAGALPAYESTVRFIIEAFSFLVEPFPELTLVICGMIRPQIETRLIHFASSTGVPKERIHFAGFLDREDLISYYAGAAALLSPLENDERSKARFPFKLGEYLSSRRPVVTSLVGDIPEYLTDRRDAMLCQPEVPIDFANAIKYLLDSPAEAARIGNAGYEVARIAFDFRNAGAPLAAFLRRMKDSA